MMGHLSNPVTILVALVATIGLAGAGAATRESEGDTMRLIDFATGATPWRSIDDVVMGGVSRSEMRVESGVAVFHGRVSLDNNGGFASVRSDPSVRDLSRYSGLRLRVRGDGKVYAIRLRTDAGFDGVSYQIKIRPDAGSWSELELPFERFEAVYRGRRVPGHPRLDPARITTFGLLIADKQVGPFRLELAWIAGMTGPPARDDG